MAKRNKHPQKKKNWQYGTAGIVPVFVPIIGGIVFLVFFIFFLIAVFQSAGVPALLGTGSFCLLGLVLLLTMNQKITYTPEEFTYRDMLRISHTYSYSQIKKIQAGKNVTIHVRHRIILIDQMASNGNQFAKIAKMHAPDAEFRTSEQAKLFGGNVHNPGEFVFIFILIGLIPVVLALVALHMGKVISPKDLQQEACEIASYEFTEQDDDTQRLELRLPEHTAAFYTWKIQPDSKAFAQLEQEIAENTAFTVSYLPKKEKDSDTLIEVVQLESADHVYLSLNDYNQNSIEARNEMLLFAGGMEILWLLFILTFSYVVRHADKHPKLVKLFVKQDYLVDKSNYR